MSATTITVNRKQFRKAITAVKAATSTSGALPVLAGIRLVAAVDRVVVEADNLDLMLRASVDAKVTGRAGSVVINAKRLAVVVGRGLAGESVTITLGKRPKITDGTTSVWLEALNDDDWPKRQPLVGESVTLTADDVAVVRRVSIAASTDWARPILCSVLLDGGQVVATDSYRLIAARVRAVPSRPVLLPLATVRALPADGCTLTIATTPEASWGDDFAGGRSRLVEGEFPRWKKPFDLPKDADHAVTAGRRALLDAALRADAVVDSHNSVIPVRLKQVGAGFSIGAVWDDHDLFSETIEADATGPAVEVAVNSRKLAELLGAFAGDRLRIDIKDALKPVLFTAAGDDPEAFRSLLMPIRTEPRSARRAA